MPQTGRKFSEGLLTAGVFTNTSMFPLMLEQEKPSYLLALRNSLILFLKWPWHTLGFTVVIFAILALSTWLRFPWAVIGASMPALLASVCIKNKTEEVRKSLSEANNIKLKQGEI
jgi:hypothetical protein